MITEINESKKLTKHISWECKCKFDCRKCNSNQKWNKDKCRFECKNGNCKYLASIINNSVITCDEIIRKTKTVATNFNKKI